MFAIMAKIFIGCFLTAISCIAYLMLLSGSYGWFTFTTVCLIILLVGVFGDEH